ncbi:hypothetical protein [uncultured Fluviicola sp.]|uniref:hypothetical protein n=1 Tax=uncultured Fluviicola sp. TaxID=463303 RepID=UPI0025FE457F|nr:hypothetical protein [uncultured Fluviicola sp.]
MKSIFCFLLIALLAACNSADTLEAGTLKQILVFKSGFDSGKENRLRLSERKVFDEKGLLLSDVTYKESGGIDYKNEYVYDTKGRKTKVTYFLGNKCHSISEFIYNNNDSIHMIVVCKPDNKIDFTIQPCYTKKGFNYQDICRGADQKIRFWDAYERNGSGRLEKWTRFNPDSTVRSKVVYKYDKQGREIKNTCSGELGGTYAFKYNKRGLIREEIARNTGDKSFLWLKVYIYDKWDNVAKIVQYNDFDDRPENPYMAVSYRYEYW